MAMTSSDIVTLLMPIFATGAVLLTGVAVVYQATHRKSGRKRRTSFAHDGYVGPGTGGAGSGIAKAIAGTYEESKSTPAEEGDLTPVPGPTHNPAAESGTNVAAAGEDVLNQAVQTSSVPEEIARDLAAVGAAEESAAGEHQESVSSRSPNTEIRHPGWTMMQLNGIKPAQTEAAEDALAESSRREQYAALGMLAGMLTLPVSDDMPSDVANDVENQTWTEESREILAGLFRPDMNFYEPIEVSPEQRIVLQRLNQMTISTSVPEEIRAEFLKKLFELRMLLDDFHTARPLLDELLRMVVELPSFQEGIKQLDKRQTARGFRTAS
jgi:hypothetical protein